MKIKISVFDKLIFEIDVEHLLPMLVYRGIKTTDILKLKPGTPMKAEVRNQNQVIVHYWEVSEIDED